MKQVAIIYASSQGSTAEIAGYFQSIFRTHRVIARLYTAEQAINSGVIQADAYLLGSAIHGGRILPSMVRFTEHYRDRLNNAPVYCWINCLRVQEPAFGQVQGAYYRALNPALQSLNMRSFKVFAGKLNMAQLSPRSRWGMTLQYDGKLNPAALDGDHRDWDAMGNWMTRIVSDLYYREGVTVR